MDASSRQPPLPVPPHAYLHGEGEAHWAGLRTSTATAFTSAGIGGGVWALFGAAAVAMVVCAGAALSMMEPAPERTGMRTWEERAPVEEAAPPSSTPTDRPIVAISVGGELVDAGDGVLVSPVASPRSLTVHSRAVLRSRPNDPDAGSLGVVSPGQRLRVIGQMRFGDDDFWLQVRTDNGGIAYVDAADAVFLDVWRRAQEAARPRDEETEAMAAAITNSGPVMGAPLQPGVPPREAAPPREAGVLY